MSLLINIVIPVYNEEQGIRQTYSQVKEVLSSYPSHEILFVDDGSNDRSRDILRELASIDPQVKMISPKGHGSNGQLRIKMPMSQKPKCLFEIA